jgi:hypothetical protein
MEQAATSGQIVRDAEVFQPILSGRAVCHFARVDVPSLRRHGSSRFKDELQQLCAGGKIENLEPFITCKA